jgi:hypothetical protein
VVNLLNKTILPNVKTEIAELQFDAYQGNDIFVLKD